MRLKTIRSDDSVTHLAIVGRLDIQGVSDIQYEFLSLTTLAPRATLIDLSGTSYIASLGIGMLVSAARHVQQRGAKLVLLSPSTHIREALKTSGLDHVIPIADDEATALGLLR